MIAAPPVRKAPARLADPTFTRVRPGLLQRKCACGGAPGSTGECDECRKKGLQRRVAQPSTLNHQHCEVPPIVHEVLRSPGQTLDATTRNFMESAFGHNFGQVRVHTDAQAAESTRRVSALAYTVGSDMVFGAGQYAPRTATGQRLIAHELTHVVQQAGTNASLQCWLPIGRVNDPSEHEADRIADEVMNGNATGVRPALSSGRVVRRQYDTPQRLTDPPRQTTIDESSDTKVDITRSFLSCPCSRVSDTRTGIFYNPALQNLAIAYKHCHGSTTFETYLKTATSFSQGQAPPQADARIGIDVNVWGTNTQGRMVIEALGVNQGSGPGIGGHAQLVFQGGSWRVFLEAQYLRQLSGLVPGTNPNKLDFDLGGQIGKFSAEIKANDVVNLTRDINIAGGYDLTPNIRIVMTLDIQGSATRSTPVFTPGIGLEIPLGGPKAKREECYQCLCPPPVHKFRCRRHSFRLVPQKPVTTQPVFRYYFKYWKTDPSEDAALVSRSNANLDQVRALIDKDYTISQIVAYASPEGAELTINRPLAQDRAKQIASLLSSGSHPVPVPPVVFGRSELYGLPAAETSPRSSPSAAGGFHAPGEALPGLSRHEIANPKLADRIYNELQGKTTDQWMTFFGLDSSDPLRSHVEDVVSAFLLSGAGNVGRLEEVYRLLRYAAIVMEGKETPEPVPEQSVGDEWSGEDCDRLAKGAEKLNRFGPVDPDAQRPSSRDAESGETCSAPAPDDVKAGCDYTLPANLQGRSAPGAPSYAPQQM